jgi:hypothetical protein
MTQAGRIIGTPRYMSPEQISSQPVEPTADVYSTGVMLYEMLTGRVPFEDTTLGGLLILHLKEPPPPFASRDFPYADDLPAALEQAVVRAMAKRPSDRQSGADELRLAIEAAVGLKSPRKYADRRSSGPKRVDGVDSDIVILPPPVPDDADPEGILLADGDDPDEDAATRMMAPRAVARVRTPSQVVVAQRPAAPMHAPVEYAEDLEEAIPVDGELPVSPRQSRRGRWMAMAIFVVLVGSVVVAFMQFGPDVPRVERLRAQRVQTRALEAGGLSAVRGPEEAAPPGAEPVDPDDPTGEVTELEEVGLIEAVAPAETVAPEPVDEAATRAEVLPAAGLEAEAVELEAEAVELEAEAVVVAPEPPVTVEPLGTGVAAPEPKEAAPIEKPAPRPKVVAQPRPRNTPKPAPIAKKPEPPLPTVVIPTPNREPPRSTVPVAEQKPEKKEKPAVVPLVDEPARKPAAQKEAETPRVAAPVVPLLD